MPVYFRVTKKDNLYSKYVFTVSIDVTISEISFRVNSDSPTTGVEIMNIKKGMIKGYEYMFEIPKDKLFFGNNKLSLYGKDINNNWGLGINNII